VARIWEYRGIPIQSKNLTATVPVPKPYENHTGKNNFYVFTPCLFWDRIWICLRIRGWLVKEFFKISKNWRSYREGRGKNINGSIYALRWSLTTIRYRVPREPDNCVCVHTCVHTHRWFNITVTNLRKLMSQFWSKPFTVQLGTRVLTNFEINLAPSFLNFVRQAVPVTSVFLNYYRPGLLFAFFGDAKTLVRVNP
jgi:hypothetical protein